MKRMWAPGRLAGCWFWRLITLSSWLCLYTWTSAWLVWVDEHNNRPEGSEVTSEFDWHISWAVSVCVTVVLSVLHLQKIDSLSLRATLSEWTITSQEHCALSQSCILTQPWLRSTEHNLSLYKWHCLLHLLHSDWYDFR